MKITDIRIKRLPQEGKMCGVASVTLDDEFVVHDIKIIEGENGYFIAMPNRKTKEGEYRDVAHPIKSETRNMLQEMILKAFEETKEE